MNRTEYRTEQSFPAAGLPAALALALAILLTTTAMVLGVATAQAATAPVKQVLVSHFGAKVDATTGANVCTVASADACQLGEPSSIPGGFESAGDVAGAPTGDVYVADTLNHRVQELTATGQFVLMFGREVNETTKGDVCTAEEIEKSGVKCKTGVGGSAVGQFSAPQSVAVDPVSGDIYVAEFVFGSGTFGRRVQKFTSAGQFVLEIGREVNETTKANLCTAEEVENSGVKCKGPASTETGSTENSAFNFAQSLGDLLAVGGPEDLLYVGDEHRVQEFEADGIWAGEIPLTSIFSGPGAKVTALALDATGDAYLAYRSSSVGETNVVRGFDSSGKPSSSFVVAAREPNSESRIKSIAIDSVGDLAVEATESGGGTDRATGSLYVAETGHFLTPFTVPDSHGSTGIAFNGAGELYAVSSIGNEVLAYTPLPVAELLTGSYSCETGADHESSTTFDCTLIGEVNPWEVSETEAFFQWGKTTALGSETPAQAVPTGNALVKVSAPLTGLRPSETYRYRLAGHDHNVKSPELLTGDTASFTTPIVAPRIVGEPSASFVTSSSAVMSGQLNPENAGATYEFQYGACEDLESCPGLASTASAESAAYGKIGTTLEATGLQPGTTYHFRLFAENLAGSTYGEAGIFTTGPAPQVQAVTGSASAFTTTGALISGAVNPDGQPASYRFELGLDRGAATRYGTVFSGPAGSGFDSVEETLALTGLQPGVTYAFRVAVRSGYGEATGQRATFTTLALPAVQFAPTPPGPIIRARFPQRCGRGKVRRHGKCVKRHHKRSHHNRGGTR